MLLSDRFNAAHDTGRRIMAADIKKCVAEHFGVSMVVLTGNGAYQKSALPRQVGMYLTRGLTPYSLPHIAKLFGRKDHSTVRHAVQKVDAICAKDPDFRAKLERIVDEVTGNA